MANLLNQNIGTNYKGILNLNTLNGNLSGTLQAVTDGDGNASPLQLSTTQAAVNGQLSVLKDSGTLAYIGNTAGNSGFNFLYNQIAGVGGNAFYITNSGSNIIFETSLVERGRFTGANFVLGHTSASARLHVRGDGTNPIARFENSTGANFLTINNSGQTIFGSSGANEPYLVNYNGTATESGTGQSLRIRQRANTGATGNTLIQYWADGLFSGTTSGTAISHEFLSSGFAGAAGNANYRNTTFAYTINNSGAQTGTATGIFLNATETALNGMTHNLMDLQVGGNSRFSVNRGGTIIAASYIYGAAFGSNSRMVLKGSSADGIAIITNNAENDFNRLQFGGTTNAFPALKRNGAALEVRLADDSGYSSLNALNFRAFGSVHNVTYGFGGNGSECVITSSGFGPILNSSGSNNVWGQWGADVLHLVGSGGAPNRIGYNMIIQAGISTGNVNGGDILFRGNRTNGTAGSSSLNTIETLVTIKNTGEILAPYGGIFGASSLNASAILQADSTTKGFLPPRMTNTQMTAIATPATGLVVYDTTNNRLNVYDGTNWISLH